MDANPLEISGAPHDASSLAVAPVRCQLLPRKRGGRMESARIGRLALMEVIDTVRMLPTSREFSGNIRGGGSLEDDCEDLVARTLTMEHAHGPHAPRTRHGPFWNPSDYFGVRPRGSSR